MNRETFKIGDSGSFTDKDGNTIEWRAVRGDRVNSWYHEPDVKFEIRAINWSPFGFDLLGCLLVALAENEGRVYNQPHHDGENRVWDYITTVRRLGWKKAYWEMVGKPRLKKKRSK